MNKHYRTLIAGLFIAISLWGGTLAAAQDTATPSVVVDSYLASLSAGDTTTLVALIDGQMKRGNRQLELSPETYAQFLRNHYAGVQMTVEEIYPDAGKMFARVRFDYPGSDSSIIEFVLTQVGGQWKITDERF